MHPDLQYRFIKLLIGEAMENDFIFIIATHSTAIISALSEMQHDAAIAFLTGGIKEANFISITETYKKIVPVFGAHTLTQIFNSYKLLLVEGDGEVRIWKSAVRSSQGKIKLYPCKTDGVGKLKKYEQDTLTLIKAVCDNGAKAFSLRDLDDKEAKELQDIENTIIRLRLECRTAENLLLTNEVLQHLGTDFNELKKGTQEWLNDTKQHKYKDKVVEFKDSFNRQDFNIKDIRNIIMGSIIGSNKSWDIVVGQVIGELNFIDMTTNLDNKLQEEGLYINS